MPLNWGSFVYVAETHSCDIVCPDPNAYPESYVAENGMTEWFCECYEFFARYAGDSDLCYRDCTDVEFGVAI